MDFSLKHFLKGMGNLMIKHRTTHIKKRKEVAYVDYSYKNIDVEVYQSTPPSISSMGS